MKQFKSEKVILIIEDGDIEKWNPGKGKTIDYLFIPEKDKQLFKKSEMRIALIPCLSQTGKIIYY